MQNFTTTNTNIALTHNDAYTEHNVVCMTSIMENKKENEKINFFIVDGGLSDFSKERINEIKTLGDCEINFIKVESSLFKDYKKSDYYPVQILYTMILADIINVERLIYLDCDLIVHSSLNELMNLDLDGFYVGAVEDANGVKYAKRYGLGSEKFFNTGLMVLNCSMWRKNNIGKTASKEAIEKTGTREGYDQTILNKLFVKKVKYLDLKWNLQYCPLNIWVSYKNMEEYKRAIENPKVIHYVGDYKPWVKGLGCFNPKQKDYFKYHELTCYKKSDLKKWLFEDKSQSYKGILAFLKRYPLFFLKKGFWKAKISY